MAVKRSVVGYLVGVLIFVGLPLLAWGLNDLAGFFDHTARLGYAVLMLALQAVIAATLPDASADGAAPSQRSGDAAPDDAAPAGVLDLLLIQVLSLGVVLLAPFSDRQGWQVGSDGLRYAGLVIVTAGLLGMHWAMLSLGRQFSVQVELQNDHQLITGGPYHYVRHPRYMGILIFMTGIALVFAAWPALLTVIALGGVLMWRIQREETMLHHAFGAEWERYTQHSWRLIPFVY